MSAPSERDRDMAGRIVAAWRTWWGDLVDRTPPGMNLPEVPGALSRLRFADDIAGALAQARAEGYAAGIEAAAKEHENVMPFCDHDPMAGAGAMGAIIRYRSAIRALGASGAEKGER